MKRTLRCFLTAVVALLPSPLASILLRVLGHKVGKNVRIGFSLVLVERLCLGNRSYIGHFNLVRCRRVILRNNSKIRHMNAVVGPISVCLHDGAFLGNRNLVKRARPPVTYGPAILKLGKISAITASHIVDCTNSVIFGDYTTLAGAGSQIWTHGYYHMAEGIDRFRVDGKVVVGNNCSIGSGVIISAGVRIANHVMVGSHSSVSKNLTESGMYVSQSLRYIPLDIDRVLDKLELVTEPCSDRVYRKKSVLEPIASETAPQMDQRINH